MTERMVMTKRSLVKTTISFFRPYRLCTDSLDPENGMYYNMVVDQLSPALNLLLIELESQRVEWHNTIYFFLICN